MCHQFNKLAEGKGETQDGAGSTAVNALGDEVDDAAAACLLYGGGGSTKLFADLHSYHARPSLQWEVLNKILHVLTHKTRSNNRCTMTHSHTLGNLTGPLLSVFLQTLKLVLIFKTADTIVLVPARVMPHVRDM